MRALVFSNYSDWDADTVGFISHVSIDPDNLKAEMEAETRRIFKNYLNLADPANANATLTAVKHHTKDTINDLADELELNVMTEWPLDHATTLDFADNTTVFVGWIFIK